MKTTILAILLTLSAAIAQEPDPIEKKLQQALFAEEGARDLDKAIEAYNAVIADYDEQRKFAATAIYRLAECHRKKDQKEQAVAAYRRLLEEFPEEATLVRLAGENLAALGAEPPQGEATQSSSEPAEIARIKQLVALSPDLINDPETGLLHQAAAKSQLKVAKFLIESGADVNLVSAGKTALERAAGGGHLAMTEFLLASGAELSQHALGWATMNQRSAVLDKLLDALPDGRAELLVEATQAAANRGRADYLRKLIAKGAEPVGISSAIANANLDCVRMLLDAGATADDAAVVLAVRGSGKDTDQIFRLVWESCSKPAIALRVALEECGNTARSLEIVNSLADIDAEDGLGTTLLGYLAYQKRPDLVRAAIASGADPKQKDSGGMSPLMWAVISDSEIKNDYATYERNLAEVVDLLLQAGADIDAENQNGETPITLAAWGKQNSGYWGALPTPVVKRLLAAGPDPQQVNPKGQPLTSANDHLVRRYALLRMPTRDDSVWSFKPGSSFLREASATPIQLSQLLLDEPNSGLSITIYESGSNEPKEIDYAELVAGGDPAKDPLLIPGTLVELKEAEQKEIDPSVYAFLQKAAAKSVTVSRGDHQWAGEVRPGNRPDHPYDPSQRIAYADTVKGLLDAIWAPTQTSDLTRVEVKHADGETSLVNLLFDLPLRDGDHITLHPLESPAMQSAIWLSREADLFLYPISDNAGIPGAALQGINLPELIAATYSSGEFVLPSPALDQITIKGADGSVTVDLAEASKEKPFTLVAGDIIDVPSREQPDANWSRLDDATTAHLAKFLAREAQFSIEGGTTRQLKVGPQFYEFPIGDDGLRSSLPLATQYDDQFDVLGLSVVAAIARLGYQASDKLNVSFKSQQTSGTYLAMNLDPASQWMPMIIPGDFIHVTMNPRSDRRSPSRNTAARASSYQRSVPQPQRSPAPRPGQAAIDAINAANAAAADAARAKQNPRTPSNSKSSNTKPHTTGRRVVLPPKNR